MLFANCTLVKACAGLALNLPGWRWAGIKQLALVGSSSSLHSEACKALGGSDGVIHSRISDSGGRVRANTNRLFKVNSTSPPANRSRSWPSSPSQTRSQPSWPSSPSRTRSRPDGQTESCCVAADPPPPARPARPPPPELLLLLLVLVLPTVCGHKVHWFSTHSVAEEGLH